MLKTRLTLGLALAAMAAAACAPMTTVVLWLLLSTGYQNGEVRVVERFAKVEDCQRVIDAIKPFARGGLRCVQTAVVKP